MQRPAKGEPERRTPHIPQNRCNSRIDNKTMADIIHDKHILRNRMQLWLSHCADDDACNSVRPEGDHVRHEANKSYKPAFGMLPIKCDRPEEMGEYVHEKEMLPFLLKIAK